MLFVLTVALAGLLAASCGAKAALPTTLQAYVPNAQDGTVSAIDLQTLEVTWTARVGERASHGIAASPDGAIVYAGDAATNEVVVLEGATGQAVRRIPVSHALHGMDIAPDGLTLWVGGALGEDPIKGTLTIIDTASNTIRGTVSPAVGDASHFAFTPDGREVWVASTSTNLIWLVDGRSGEFLTTVPLVPPPGSEGPMDQWGQRLAEYGLIGLNEVALSPDGRYAYAVGPNTSVLFAVDVRKRAVLGTVEAGERAHGVTVSPDGKEIWVSDWSGLVSIFSAPSLEPVTSVRLARPGPTERGANHVAFSRDGRRAFVTSMGELVVLDSASRSIERRLAIGQEPHEISLEDAVAPGAILDTAGILRTARSSSLATAPEASSSRAGGGDESPVRVDSRGAVVVEVVPTGFDPGAASLEFQISLNTHSVDLGYDLAQLSLLKDDQGREFRPSAWDGGQGGHHLAGVLRFDDAGTILGPRPRQLLLEIRDIARVPVRTFVWDLER